MIVMKFGGTSNQDAAAMRNVIRLVKAHQAEQPFVVISAIAKGTNLLEQAARTAQSGDEAGALRILDGLFERHFTIRDTLLKNAGRKDELTAAFAAYREQLDKLVRGLAILGELTPRSMDAVCAYGERLSSRLIAAGLQEEGVDALWIDTKDFMITDDAFGNARPLMDEVRERLARQVRPLLSQGKVPVTQGFIGVTRTGVSTTMGRESSDYSASIIGAAMDAARVQIWTDVDGILTADPSVVKNPRLIGKMSFREAFELSYFGAKVLHPSTMLPVLEKGIPVQILNSKNASSTGTTVDAQVEPGGPCIKSIAYKRGASMIEVAPVRRVNQYLFWEGVYTVLNRNNVTIGSSQTSEYGLAFVVDVKADVTTLKRELSEVGKVATREGLGAVCLVGEGVRGTPGLLTRVFSALKSLAVHYVAAGASASSFVIIVDADVLEDAVRLLHAEFF